MNELFERFLDDPGGVLSIFLADLQTGFAQMLDGLRVILAQSGNLPDAIVVGLLAFLLVLGLARLIMPTNTVEHVSLRERLRDAELKLEAMRGQVLAAEMASAKLSGLDPKVLLRSMRAGDGAGGTAIDPAEWLEQMRPALAEAYLRLAREALGAAQSEADLAQARFLAWGAVAAAPASRPAAEILEQIEEAKRLNVFMAQSEAEALAWKIVRGDARNTGQTAPDMRVRSRRRIGLGLALTGWEADELHAAALAELDADAESEAESEAGAKTESEAEAAVLRSSGLEMRGNVAFRSSRAGDGEPEAATAIRQGAAGGEARALAAAGPGTGAVQTPNVRHLHAVPDADSGSETARKADPSRRGRMLEREAELRRLWERRRRPDMLGEAHPRTLATLANIGHELGRQGRHAEAEAAFRTALEGLRKPEALGETDPDTLTVWHNLAVEIGRQGRHDEAEREFAALTTALTATSGPGATHPLTLATRHDRAALAEARGDFKKAETGFAAVWQARRKLRDFGDDHPHTLWSRIRMLRAAEAQLQAG